MMQDKPAGESNKQPRWDLYEAVILLDGYLETLDKKLPKMRIVKQVSADLRQMAVNRGVIIDDVFRNENGISYQIKSMESAYAGHKIYVTATKLFVETVNMYRNDRQQYEKTLKEAKGMIVPIPCNKKVFMAWSTTVASKPSNKWVEENLKKVETFGNKAGIISGSIFDITDKDALERLFHSVSKSKVFQITNKKIYKQILQDLQTYRYFFENKAAILSKMQAVRNEEMVVVDAAPPNLITSVSVEMERRETASENLRIDFDGIDNLSYRQPISKYSDGLLDAAKTIIATSFVNGMRKNAVIAKKKFKNAYFEMIGDELPEDINIDDLASCVGVEYSDKIYTISEENKLRIKGFVQAAINSGNNVIFYEEVYRLNMDFMTNAGIFSSDLLKIVLKQIMPEMRYKRASFSVSDSNSLEQDIIACFGDGPMLTYGEIKSKLPYADIHQIRSICSRNSRFVWAKEETYALAEKIRLSPTDIEKSKQIVAQDIEKQGFSVLQRVTVLESVELNPYVPEAAIKEAIYVLYLAAYYKRNHSIIMLHGDSFSAPTVMTEYCKSLNEVTLSELQSYEGKLTDKTSYSLNAAYAAMVRVDNERFVSIGLISFDVWATDNALALFVQEDIIPLKGVKSFTSFPEVEGYAWNLFLLDSYCRHFSMRFRSMGGPAKSKPVGAIFPIQMQFGSYDDLLAHVAVKNNVELNADDVNKFFMDNAYTLRRIDTKGIIAKSQEIRIQEG